MGKVWESIKRFASGVRSVQTPLGGITWEKADTGSTTQDEPVIVDAPTSEESDDEPEEFELQEHHERALCAFAESDERWLHVDELADSLRISTVRAESYLDDLEATELVEKDGDHYQLTVAGRKYLVDNDLVD